MKRIGILFVGMVAVGSNCGHAGTDGGLEGGAPTLTCYVADMFRCDEEPSATPAQQTNAPAMCSSLSGVFSMTAACPMAGFQGKCTRPAASTGMDGVQVQRFYTGADIAYSQDFCVNTALGTWSTTF